MVQFIKAKKTSFVNKPTGVVSVDTGAVQAEKVQSDVFNSIASMYFKEATQQEIEKGQDYVQNLPTRKMVIEETDSLGNPSVVKSELDFQPLDSSLSTIAQQTAKPLLQKKYALALSNDISRNIEQIRLDSSSAADFQTKINNFIPTYIEQINKLGGGDFTSQIQEGVGKLSTQHFFDMSLKEKNLNIVNQANETNNALLSSIQETEASASNYANMGDFNVFLKELKEQQKEQRSLFNSSVAEYGLVGYTKTQIDAMKIKIAISPARGLLKGFSRGKNSLQLELAESYLRNGSKGPELSAKDYEFLDVIKKEAGQHVNYLIEDASKLSASIRTVQSDRRTFNNDRDSVITKAETKIKNNPETADNNDNFKFFIEETFTDSAVNNFINNGVFDNEAFKSLNDRISKSRGVKQKDSQFGFINNGKDEVTSLKHSVIAYTATKLFQHPDTMNTNGGLAKVISKLANPNKEINFTDKEQSFYDAMIKLSELHDRGKSVGSTVLQKHLSSILTSANKDAVRSKKAQSDINNRTNIVNNKPQNTVSENKYVDEQYGIEPDSFQTAGKFNYKSDGNLNEKHKTLDSLIINNGVMSHSLKTTLNALSNGNLKGEQAITALSFFSRYSNVRNGYSANPQNALVRAGLDVKVNNKLEMIVDLFTDFKGQTSIFDQAGTGPNGQIRIDDVISVVNRLGTKNYSDINMKQYGDKVTNAKTYLYSLGFKGAEVNDLEAAAEIGLKLNIEPEKLKSVLTNIKDKVYHDTDGIVVDPFFSSVVDKSKFALSAMIPNPEKKDEIINLINSRLPANAMLNNTVFTITDSVDESIAQIDDESAFEGSTTVFKDKPMSSKFIVGQTSATETMLKMEQRDAAEPLAFRKTDKSTELAKNRIYLVPIVTGFTGGDTQKKNIIYQAVHINEYGTFQPFIDDGNFFVFDLDELIDSTKSSAEINNSIDVFESKEEQSKGEVQARLGGLR